MTRMLLASAAVLALFVAGTATAKQEKVTICHFPGHEARGSSGNGAITQGHPDYVLVGEGLACEEAGGQVIDVAKVGAVRGHKALDGPSGDPLELDD